MAAVLGCCISAFFFGHRNRPRIEVSKSKRELRFYKGNHLFKTYRMGLGSNPISPKEREGDGATPEGSYLICAKNPASKFRLSLAINYPNAVDAKRGLKGGIISQAEYEEIMRADGNHTTPPWNTALGGEIFVHGNGSSSDWTLGCIALSDSDIEELYNLIPLSTPITIFR
jgi:murein L,D-transpeptidase YafK